MNVTFFNLINGWAGRYDWLDIAMIFSAKYLWLILVFWVLALAARNRRFKDMALVAIGSAAFARLVIVFIIKWLYNHPRPELAMHINAIVKAGNGPSFPSGHTAFVFALATGVYLYDKKIGRWYLALATLVGFSRIFVGVHWPFDILAGVMVGVIATPIFNRYYRKYKVTGTPKFRPICE